MRFLQGDSHTKRERKLNALSTTLAAEDADLEQQLTGKADLVHVHTLSQVTGLEASTRDAEALRLFLQP